MLTPRLLRRCPMPSRACSSSLVYFSLLLHGIYTWHSLARTFNYNRARTNQRSCVTLLDTPDINRPRTLLYYSGEKREKINYESYAEYSKIAWLFQTIIPRIYLYC